ncbi:MAG: hypothetical protein LBT97_11395, partial [Planctomycetota bacterium]|nr:hypothetical protein [Planctomycetota bacterium]
MAAAGIEAFGIRIRTRWGKREWDLFHAGRVPGFFAWRIKWTFGENQTNRRLILSKVSWVYILRRELLQGRRYRPTGRKINPLVRKRQHLWRKSGGGWSDFLQ